MCSAMLRHVPGCYFINDYVEMCNVQCVVAHRPGVSVYGVFAYSVVLCDKSGAILIYRPKRAVFLFCCSIRMSLN